MNLFEITQDYLQLMQELEENGGEITDDINERLNINRDELEHKVKGYHHIIQMTKGHINTIDNEIIRLRDIKERKEKSIETMKKALLTATQLFGYNGKSGNKKLDFDTLKLYTSSSDRVIVDDVAFKDERYIRYSVCEDLTPEDVKKVNQVLNKELLVDKKVLRNEIKKALKDGLEVEAYLEKNEFLIIK